jgi:hypothetical protein
MFQLRQLNKICRSELVSPCLPSRSWAKAGACVTLPAKPKLGEGWSVVEGRRTKGVREQLPGTVQMNTENLYLQEFIFIN